jgi:hypothetical protein
MLQASPLLRQKAEEYNIDIDETTGLGLVRVCKRMLEGHLSLLRLSHEKVMPQIERMENELREIEDAFEYSLDPTMTLVLIGQGHIHSRDNLLTELRTAYTKMFIAHSRKKAKDDAENNQKKDNRAAPPGFIAGCLEDISNYCFDSKNAISRALKCFDQAL